MSEPSIPEIGLLPTTRGQTDSVRRIAIEQSVSQVFEVCHPFETAFLRVFALCQVHQLSYRELLESLAPTLPYRHRIALGKFVESVEDGTDPVQAFNDSPDLLPANVILTIKTHQQRGNLDDWLNAVLLHRKQLSSADDSRFQTTNLTSLVAKTIFILSFLGFIGLRIIPEFKEMCEEFEVELPMAMVGLISTLDGIAKFWFIWFLLAAGVFFYCSPKVRSVLRSFSPSRWRTRLESRQVSRIEVLANLSRTGEPISKSLTELKRSAATLELGSQFTKALENAYPDENIWDCLARHKMISKRDAKSLHLLESEESKTWILQQIAIGRRNREFFRFGFSNQSLVVFVNLVLTILVALAAMAIFQTLIAIIQKM